MEYKRVSAIMYMRWYFYFILQGQESIVVLYESIAFSMFMWYVFIGSHGCGDNVQMFSWNEVKRGSISGYSSWVYTHSLEGNITVLQLPTQGVWDSIEECECSVLYMPNNFLLSKCNKSTSLVLLSFWLIFHMILDTNHSLCLYGVCSKYLYFVDFI